MLVKCKICGQKVERSDAYKIVVDGKNNYYCNQSEYEEWMRKRKLRDDSYLIIYDIFGRKVENTVLYKEVDQLGKTHSFEKIFAYLKENKDYLDSVMQKEFANEYGQIRYFAAILKNSLYDFKIKEEVVRTVEIDIPENKFKSRKSRKAMVDYEAEVGDEL